MYQIRQPKVTRLPDFFTIFLLSIQRFRPTTDFGEFPLAHDSIPQLILEKPQVILDTPDMLALLNRSRSASGIFLYLSITYYVVFS